MKRSARVGFLFLLVLMVVLMSCTEEILLYRVGFNSQGGSIVSSVGVLAGQGLDEPASPTRNGYVFAGWYTESVCTTAWDFWSDVVSADTTLYAKWIDAYTVSFDSTEGSSVGAVEIAHGAMVREPAQPTRGGFVFDGWYREIEREIQWDFATTAVTSNVTLYAKWIALHTVTFDSMGGCGVPDIMDVVDGTKITAPTAPARTRYVFEGWYKESGLVNPWDFNIETITRDTILYAKWRDYAIREIGPAGGYIFYDKGSVSNGWRYLEAAPASTEWASKVWGGFGTEVGGTDTGIGTGEANTEKIVAKYGNSGPYGNETDYAAKLCADLVVAKDSVVYDDWFLPSKDELNQMYQVLKTSSLGGFSDNYFWSSSESSSLLAWIQSLEDGSQGDDGKAFLRRVRAARAF